MNKAYRILAQGQYINSAAHITGLNNNLIVGPSGAGKTRGCVMPNIMQASESMEKLTPKPLENACLFTRGQKPRVTSKFDLRSHKAYRESAEASAQIGKERDTVWPEISNREAIPC